IKCFDQAANPYLTIGCLIAVGLAGLQKRLRLPPETTTDPAACPGPEGQPTTAQRLPESLDQALAALRQSEVIPAAMGPELHHTSTAARAAEAQAFRGQDPGTITTFHRWRY